MKDILVEVLRKVIKKFGLFLLVVLFLGFIMAIIGNILIFFLLLLIGIGVFVGVFVGEFSKELKKHGMEFEADLLLLLVLLFLALISLMRLFHKISLLDIIIVGVGLVYAISFGIKWKRKRRSK
ncbi:MAG: hypothetical protein DRP29_06100 [Thermodesulfobacteriota bacterium]|nr:MAG: hypothetical protein DRP29_06100 [Thermodesulfobacteriota bacterium]